MTTEVALAEPTVVRSRTIDPNDAVIIGIDTNDGPSHPLFDMRNRLPVNVALAMSITKDGLINKIKLRKDGDQYIVTSGRQRVRAARLADKWNREKGGKGIKIGYELEFVTEQEAGSRNRVDNSCRTDEPLWMKAESVLHQLKNGVTEAELAYDYTTKVETIELWKQYGLLDEFVKEEVRSGRFGFNACLLLAGLPQKFHKPAMVEMMTMVEKGEKVTTRVVRVLVANIKASESIEMADVAVEDETEGDETPTAAEVGAKVPGPAKSGKLIVKGKGTPRMTVAKAVSKEKAETKAKFVPPGKVQLRHMREYYALNAEYFPELESFMLALDVLAGDVEMSSIEEVTRLLTSMEKEGAAAKKSGKTHVETKAAPVVEPVAE